MTCSSQRPIKKPPKAWIGPLLKVQELRVGTSPVASLFLPCSCLDADRLLTDCILTILGHNAIARPINGCSILGVLPFS